MATLTQLENALLKAHDAGDRDSAQVLAEEIRRKRRNRGSILDPIKQGLTFGWGEELGGFGARLGARLAGAPEERVARAGEDYAARGRARLRDYREREPVTAFAAEMASSLIPGLGALGHVSKGLQAIRGMGPARSLAGAGALEGAVAGAGAADEDKLLGAGVGGAVGGAMGGATPLLERGASAAWGATGAPLMRRLREEPTTAASRVLQERMAAEGLSPTQLRARQRQMGPEATLSDIGYGPRGLAQGVIDRDKTGTALARARNVYSQRAAGGTERVRGAVAEATGVQGRFDPTIEALRERQKALAEPLYARSNAATISLTPGLKSLLNRKKMQQAFKEAQEAADTRGEELPPFMQLDDIGDWEQVGVMPDMQAWDRMKQGIDRLIDSEIDAVTGRMSAKGRDLTIMKNELAGELDRVNPAYAEARQVFAGEQALQDAMRNGKRFLNLETGTVKTLTKDMTDSEKQAFLMGAVESMREKIGRARAGEIGQFKFLEVPNTAEKLKDMFPEGRQGQRQLAQLMRAMRRERGFAETRSDVVGGAQSALRRAAGEALQSNVMVPTSTEVLTSPGRGTANAILGRVSQAMSGLGDKAIGELAELLFDPNNVEAVITEMQRRGIPQQQINQFVGRFSRGVTSMAPAAGLMGGGIMNQE